MTTSKDVARGTVGEYQWGFHDEEQPLFMAEKGLNEAVIRGMSEMKGEPEWMLEYRLDAYRQFLQLQRGHPQKGRSLIERGIAQPSIVPLQCIHHIHCRFPGMVMRLFDPLINVLSQFIGNHPKSPVRIRHYIVH